MGIWEYRNMIKRRIWKYKELGNMGKMKNWEHGNMEKWEYGNTGTREDGKRIKLTYGVCEYGNTGMWENGKTGKRETR